MKALIVYATIEGHTRKIANHIAHVLKDEGIEPIQCSAKDVGDAIHAEYAFIVLCAPIHVGRYPKKMVEFVRGTTDVLKNTTTAFVSVSLGINSADEKEKVAARGYAEKLFKATNWKPNFVHHVAGAIQYKKYGVFKRVLMTWIAKREGGPTNTQENHEFTDWYALSAFVKDLTASESVGILACYKTGR